MTATRQPTSWARAYRVGLYVNNFEAGSSITEATENVARDLLTALRDKTVIWHVREWIIGQSAPVVTYEIWTVKGVVTRKGPLCSATMFFTDGLTLYCQRQPGHEGDHRVSGYVHWHIVEFDQAHGHPHAYTWERPPPLVGEPEEITNDSSKT